MRSPTVQQVLGSNLRRRRLRAGWNQDQAAAVARSVGLPWSRATLAAVETGHRDVSLEETFLLTLVHRCPLSDLLASNAAVVTVGGSQFSGRELRQLSKGVPLSDRAVNTKMASVQAQARRASKNDPVVRLATSFGLGRDEAYAAFAASQQDAERRLAARLTSSLGEEVTALEVGMAAFCLWQVGLTEERDSYMSEEAERHGARGRRAHLTRSLQAEIELLLRRRKAETYPNSSLQPVQEGESCD